MSFNISNGLVTNGEHIDELPVTPGTAKSLVKTFESWDIAANTQKNTADFPKDVEFKSKDIKQAIETGQIPTSTSPTQLDANRASTATRTMVQAFESGELVDTTERKNILLVYAHQEPKSFNGAMKNTTVESLKRQGHTVEVSDLYEMNFEPRATRNDMKGKLKNEDVFKYPVEQAAAYESDSLADDIKLEQAKIKAASIVVFQFPLYWGSFPAILKGWFDRVLGAGFSYGNGNFFDKSPLYGKRALLSFTTGGGEPGYGNDGILGDVDVILWTMHNMALRFNGFEILAPEIVYGPSYLTDEGRQERLQSWGNRLKGLVKEKPVRFLKLENFDKDTFTLSQSFYDTPLGKGEKAATVGQNLGKALAARSMREAW